MNVVRERFRLRGRDFRCRRTRYAIFGSARENAVERHEWVVYRVGDSGRVIMAKAVFFIASRCDNVHG